MTQPQDAMQAEVFVSTDTPLGPLPQNPGGRSALQSDVLALRELTDEELAEDDDEPGTGMTEAEIDAFLGQEIAVAAVAEEPAAVGPSDQPEEA